MATKVYDSTRFLYEGEDPVQTGVDEETMEPRRVAVLRGQVSDRSGSPLQAVRISILDHPESGQTWTREDGMFDLAVNGGGHLTVKYEKLGYLPAQRQIQVPWQDFVWLPEVVLIQLDTEVTPVDLNQTAEEFVVAQSSEVSDSDGSRQATLLVPKGTQAELVMPDGTTQAMDTLNIRATEYTVGESGPLAMPAELPPTSGYTYPAFLTRDAKKDSPI